MFSTLTSLVSRIMSVKNILQSPKILLCGLLVLLSASTLTMHHLWKESRSQAKIERSARDEAETANAQLKSDYNQLILSSQASIEEISKRTEELEKSYHATDNAKTKHRATGRTRAGDVLKPADVDILRQRTEEIRKNVHSRAAHTEGGSATKNATPAE